MNVPRKFTIYAARVPFLDLPKNKIRPVIVVSDLQGPHDVVVVVPISSRPTDAQVDMSITGWDESGLAKPSVARVHRLFTLLKTDLVSEIGLMQKPDVDTLKTSLRKLLDL